MYTQDIARKPAADPKKKAKKDKNNPALPAETDVDAPQSREEKAQQEFHADLKAANKLKQLFAKVKFQGEALVQVAAAADGESPYMWARCQDIIGKLTTALKALEENTNSFARMFLYSDNKTCRIRSGVSFQADLKSFNSLSCKVLAVQSEHSQIVRMHNSRGSKDSPSK